MEAKSLRHLAAGLGILTVTALGLYSVSGEDPRPATEFERERSLFESELAPLERIAFDPPATEETRLQLLSRLHQKASLTERDEDYRRLNLALARVWEREGPTPELCLLRATLEFRMHRLSEARRVLGLLPGLSRTRKGASLEASIAFEEGRMDEAVRGGREVLERFRSWDALARLAGFEAKRGRDSEAERLYEEAEGEITSKEMRAYAWVELQRGRLALERGRYDEADRRYQEASRAYSGYFLTYEYLAELRGAQGRFEEAVALYERAVAQNPRPETQQALGDLHAFMGRPDLARPWHEKAIDGYLASVGSGEIRYLHHLAGYYADVSGQASEAVACARRDCELRRNGSTREALAWAEFRSGHFEAAELEIRSAIDSGLVSVHLYQHAGMILLGAGRTEEGRSCLAKADALNPRNKDFHAHR